MSPKTIAIISVLVVVAAATIFLLSQKQPSGQSAATSPLGAPVTRTEAPKNIAVPDMHTQNVPQNVAAPTTISPAGPNTTANFRSFAIRVEHDAFSPNTVIVKQGDVTHISFTAIDKNYDFAQPDYGLSSPLPSGREKIIEFGAGLSGKFTFYCTSCGGPTKGPVGYIIVTQK